ncbi:phosphodiesterase [Clostridiaceae bacterium 68-1-5]|uniref:Phosphoesterase n=1 Tax=Suipraeoptans intestinalis TaxID=2606628 RepID=A0A6N7URM6_9FIRM|nr:phosphodiesterase [Suipraeoptans intestinalis]MSR93391.1 phosphodiesterase [Suipraeoptans intestinalis]
MKLMIASDIHGSAYYCQQLVAAYHREQPDRLLLLGDLLYHGPRNDLPRDYSPKKVISLLNPLRSSVLCVRGNCESEVDQMVLDFPILADYAFLEINGHTIFATHGHLFSPDNPPPLKAGDTLLCGHTHISANRDMGGWYYRNPGSVSLPKEGSFHGYMVLEKDFIWKTLEGTPVKV